MSAAGTVALAAASLFLAHAAHALEAEGSVRAAGTVEYAFPPDGDAAALVVRAIEGARSQVLVQAFSFTHRGIADALVRAHRRGVDVQVIADLEQTATAGSAAMAGLVDAGVPVFTDGEHAAAHGKVVVVDAGSPHAALVTGSFNFTFAAQNRNAENVIVLRDNPELAQAFAENWHLHRGHATAMRRPAAQ